MKWRSIVNGGIPFRFQARLLTNLPSGTVRTRVSAAGYRSRERRMGARFSILAVEIDAPQCGVARFVAVVRRRPWDRFHA